MRIVITCPDYFPNEAEQIIRLFEDGLQILHLRKPNSSLADYERLIREIPAQYHNRIVLHEHFHLVKKYGLRGMHLKASPNPSKGGELLAHDILMSNEQRHTSPPSGGLGGATLSKSCHTIEELRDIDGFDYVFLSPVFDSISKIGYQSAFSDEVLQKASEDGLINEKVIALGGVTFENMGLLKKYNFGGVAMLGAVWGSPPKSPLKGDLAGKAPSNSPSGGRTACAELSAVRQVPFEGGFRGAFQFITHTNEKYNYLQSAELALTGGCRWVQLRMKDTPLHEIEETAIKLREMCRKFGATFIIDDHVELAQKVGADGVHIGKTDMPPEEARAILGKAFIIGGTANTFEDIKRLALAGVDYVGLGPFRFTQTKKNLSTVLGLEGYEKIIKQCRAENINLPVVAIGGITTADIPAIMNTGVCGIAVSGSVLGAVEPVEETRKILALLYYSYPCIN